MPRFGRTLLGAAIFASAAMAASNIDPAMRTAQSAFIGAVDWRPNAEFGAAINQYYCSGFLHGSNVGWIQIGASVPIDGLRYRNDSAEDFGVNVLPSGALRGFAYGSNIGWIAFEEKGNPRVNWSTGRLSGSCYSANTGWISLDAADASVRLESIGEPADLDQDGLPDAWEISRAGTLVRLESSSDSDRDGQSDRDEFLAGTNPLDQFEMLGPIQFRNIEFAAAAIEWPSKSGHLYLIERRSSLESSDSWQVLDASPMIGTGEVLSRSLSALDAAHSFYPRFPLPKMRNSQV